MKKFTLEFTVSENEMVVTAIEGYRTCDMVEFHSEINPSHLRDPHYLANLAAKCVESFGVQERLCDAAVTESSEISDGEFRCQKNSQLSFKS